MQEDIPYEPHPAIKKEMDEDAKLFNKWTFYDEVDKIHQLSVLSEEMRLVLEFFLRFQWLEEEAKDLLWHLYGATSETRLNTYMTSQKRDDIRKISTLSLIRELGYLHINEDGHTQSLEAISSQLESLNKTRNRIVHLLYSEEIKEKKQLISKLKDALKRAKNLEKQIQDLSIVYASVAAQLEVKRRFNEVI